jgi:hypothetical protein
MPSGTASAGLMSTAELLFNCIVDCVRLCTSRVMVAFNNDAATVTAVLELMNAVASTLITYLSQVR